MSRASGLSVAEARHAAPLFAALGDPTRLQLLQRLCRGGPGSIQQLSDKAEVSRQAIRKHLDVLEQAGLVRSARRGRECRWELQPRRLDDAHDYLERISKQWDDALARLAAFVED
ncbi:MAG: helix-turn-helix transcriptional regulator [Deltaproteobacteria bacterium]|nr:helix-turn-helix transcriptional regulator [Deltaproteobacteria bacterium]MBK8236174.1 helix-turn-helix transcriptional regulator [Deltaproteobacteria bacterium]MBK8713780.1 helix-turn-helix transcriptional regulator [Deltaproteobacteria bacterium]MBP7290271.1 helix-turn-helix transcriptional regulator [Nannocystaceae bacterium]